MTVLAPVLAPFAFALALAQPPAAESAPVLGLALQPPVGLSEEEAAQAHKKIVEELAGLGVQVVSVAAVDASCVGDTVCVESARQALAEPATGLLVVELVRVGPVVQLTATGAAGEARAGGSHGLDAAALVSGDAAALPDDVRVWAKALVPAVVDVPPPPPPPPPPPEGAFSLTPMKTASLFVGGVGALALVAGGIVAGVNEAVLQDPASDGDQKADAAGAGAAGLAVAGIGVAALAGGAALFFLTD